MSGKAFARMFRVPQHDTLRAPSPSCKQPLAPKSKHHSFRIFVIIGVIREKWNIINSHPTKKG
jgi:hypothetical protein